MTRESLRTFESLVPALKEALNRRAPLLESRPTDCYRLLCGDTEGAPGLVVERLGPVLILQLFEDAGCPPPETLLEIARWYQANLRVRSIYAKPFVKRRERLAELTAEESAPSKPFLGEPVEEEITVQENDLCFFIRPNDGLSTGLFLDQRDNRLQVRGDSRGKRVLNLFSYTCGFGVAAAAGGAVETVNVDLSPKALEWGRRNYRLNQLDAAGHEFAVGDAVELLKRIRRRQRRFDYAIVDPPSFAHGRKRGRSFSLRSDLPALIGEVSAVLVDGGRMLISTNHRGVSTQELRRMVSAGLTSRSFHVESEPPLPMDFLPDPDHAKSLIVVVG